MIEAKRYFVPTSVGDISLIFAPTQRSRVDLVVHGAGRHPVQLRRWLQHDAVLWELPGHGQARDIFGDARRWVSGIDEAIANVFGRLPVTSIGESFGGLLALMMKSERHIAFDPFIEPNAFVDRELYEGNLPPRMGELLSRSYFREVCEINHDFEIVLASLNPDRDSSTPSIVPEVTREALRSLKRARVVEMNAGHLLFDENPEGCEAIVFG